MTAQIVAKSFITLACIRKTQKEMSDADYAARNIWGIILVLIAECGFSVLFYLAPNDIGLKIIASLPLLAGGLVMILLIQIMINNVKRHTSEINRQHQ